MLPISPVPLEAPPLRLVHIAPSGTWCTLDALVSSLLPPPPPPHQHPSHSRGGVPWRTGSLRSRLPVSLRWLLAVGLASADSWRGLDRRLPSSHIYKLWKSIKKNMSDVIQVSHRLLEIVLKKINLQVMKIGHTIICVLHMATKKRASEASLCYIS